MKLNISDWESFCASDIFFLYNGSGITKEEIEDNPGSFPAVQSGADNNGCIGYISKDYCKAMNYTNDVMPGMWSGGVVGLKSILGVKRRTEALEIMDTLSRFGYIRYTLD